MTPIITALAPIFSLIVVGFVFRQAQFPGDAFWPLASRITYFAFFPALLVRELATADFTGLSLLSMSTTLVLAILIVSGMLVLVSAWLRVDHPAFTSVFQGSIRPNTYVGISAAVALYGSEGATLAAIGIAAMVPLVNLLCVLVMMRYLNTANISLRATFVSVITNPLIIACILGILLNGSGIGLPFGTAAIVDVFSRAALPLGLLTIGAGLDLRSVRDSGYPVGLAAGIKLLAFPLLTAALCGLLGVQGPAQVVTVLFAALPCAPSSYILAQQLGGDSRLMATILTVQTLLAALTMPVIVLLTGKT